MAAPASRCARSSGCDAVRFGLELRRLIPRSARVRACRGARLLFPGIIAAPAIGQPMYLSRDAHRLERDQSLAHNGQLITWIKWLTRGVPQWVIDKSGARGLAGLDNIQRAGQTHRCDSVGFQVPRDQTHGLVANWSHGDQQDGIHLLCRESLQQVRCRFLPYAPL